jgi:hypothetical protein
MPSSSAKAAKTTSYDAVCATPFTQIHGCPTRQDYELDKKEASDLASKVDNLTFAWSCDQATGEEYGLLAEIIGDVKYTHLTNLNSAQEIEPANYNPAITAATATHTRKRLKEEWEEKCKSWFTWKGFLHGVTMNMRNALNEQYYLQLKHINTAYRNTTPIQILEQLDTLWCPLDVRARKLLKADFFADWDSTVMHRTAFGVKLDKEQARISRLGILISDKDKLQFYMEQIYASNCFDKKEMLYWENKPINIKDDYNKAKLYFEGLDRDFETYTQNSGGDSGKRGYKSANQMADFGDEIRKYIQEIASTSVASNKKTAEWAANVNKESKTKNAQLQAMTAQIQALTNTIATLSKAILAAAKHGGGGGGGGISGSSSGNNIGGGGKSRLKYMRNMGAYCSMHGHHPVGANHTSATCTHKQESHNDTATADHRFGGSNFWPGLFKVKASQHDHISYKGKSAPK